jgi:hypothetical protein
MDFAVSDFTTHQELDHSPRVIRRNRIVLVERSENSWKSAALAGNSRRTKEALCVAEHPSIRLPGLTIPKYEVFCFSV